MDENWEPPGLREIVNSADFMSIQQGIRSWLGRREELNN